jgi:hypothetical protein
MKLTFLIIMAFNSLQIFAQHTQTYPTPDYDNEIYLFKKDSALLLRLEKGSSKVVTKTKLGGMGGAENAYTIDGFSSTVRLKNGNNLSFVFFAGNHTKTTTPEADSAMMASGAAFSAGMGDPMSVITDPSRTTSLYNLSSSKGKRNIVIQSYNGMKVLGKSKKESIKYTLSIKQIREGYYELQVDKPLPKGEYAFLMNSMTSMDGSSLLFAFGVD